MITVIRTVPAACTLDADSTKVQLWMEATVPAPVTEPTLPPIAAPTSETFAKGQLVLVGVAAAAAFAAAEAAAALACWVATDCAVEEEGPAAEPLDPLPDSAVAEPAVTATEEEDVAVSGLCFDVALPEAQPTTETARTQQLTTRAVTRT